MTEKLISVVIPVYNAEKYLPRCLDSVNAQTVRRDIQLILVDDGSADSSGKICDERALEGDKVLHLENSGVSAARNEGIKAAEGKYIGFVDSDDEIEPTYFEELLRAAEGSGADLACCGYTLIYPTFKREIHPFFDDKTVLTGAEVKAFAEKMLSDYSQNSACNKLFLSEKVKAGAGFPKGMKIGEDRCFVLDFLGRCERLVCTDRCGYNYYDNSQSAMHSDDTLIRIIDAASAETGLFAKLGIEEKRVLGFKRRFVFISLADRLQRLYQDDRKDFSRRAKDILKNEKIMKFISPYLTQAASEGTVYRLLAGALKKRNLTAVTAVMRLQKAINGKD